MDDISKALRDFLSSHGASTFSCGGSIPMKPSHAPGQDQHQHPHSCPPVTARWTGTGGDHHITFPLEGEDAARLPALVRDCVPATFGKDDEDVLDPTYRSAVAMDTSKFAVDFDPYILGIQGLRQSVVAELYKLNIYESPSGFFKSHVDTPRHETQFGSLVVCLPHPHQGGGLVVRHAGKDVTFDWSSTEGAVQWAAFYSDCEHEILNVTEGARVTLTYNLYARTHPADLEGLLGQELAPVDVQSLPLYEVVRAAMADPAYKTEGGTLGVFCSHAYPLSHEQTKVPIWPEDGEAIDIPNTSMVLKGTDLAVVSVFKALGMVVQVKSILQGKNTLRHCYFYHGDDEDWPGDRQSDHLGQTLVTEEGGHDCAEIEHIMEAFGDELRDVTWLTDVKHNDGHFVHLTYGNEPGVMKHYTQAAILVTVPPSAERSRLSS
ncbi:hypothetical protein Micbo1qcDRAFT_207207 [Microdochium bolleyi]|uniref:Fe2OG dioxygenase domain-containing protein n=1 Tax=Microdochium bolleyi TaxID=196109 RepID=A0A136IUB4_9PEZI|nr:hypothetical protein Micbo1qcDRAFT_207207 [Microdochium bolleyi]